MNRTLSEPIAVRVTPRQALRRLRMERVPRGLERAASFIETVAALADPRGVAVEARVSERDDRGVSVGGVRIESALLAGHLVGDRIVAYAVTLGPAVEEAASAAASPLDQYGLHEVGNLFLAKAQVRWKRRVREAFGLPRLSSLHPGGLPDWPIEGQRAVFGLLGDGARKIGVGLTESLLMVPKKSVSGIFFPSRALLVSCRHCARASCPSRRAPFVGDASPASGPACGVGAHG
ncbi:hypothetical protein [Deferrisoma sp.]